MLCLPEAQRNQTSEMSLVRVSAVNVSSLFGCSRQTMFSQRNRFQQTKRVADNKQFESPHMTTQRQDVRSCTTHLRRHFMR